MTAAPALAATGQGRGQRERPHLLLLFPGPIHDLGDYLGARLERLSESFQGAVVTLSPQASRRIGRFEVRTAPYDGPGFTRTVAQLLRLALAFMKEERQAGRSIDLVVTYDPLKTGLMGLVAARLARASLGVEVNGDYASWANYDDVRRPLLRWLKRRTYMAVERFVLARADGIKVLYPNQLAPFGGPPARSLIRCYPSFVDVAGFRDLGETPEVLLVGFPFRVKGTDLLIEAFKRVADRHPDWRLKILGWYPDLRELQSAIDGHPRIQHHPPVGRNEVAEHIGRCGILALPSRTEAMGRVLVEAMACAKPRIGTAVGGIPTVITDGVDGLLVEPEDVGALARALDRLMSDPALRRRLGEAAAARVREEFGIERYFAELTDFYDDILARRHQRAGQPRRSLDAATG